MSVSLQFLRKQLDLSGQSDLSGTDINQSVDTALPALDKGMTVFTTDVAGSPDVPNAAVDTNLARCLWIRITATQVLTYIWDPYAVSAAPLLKWTLITTTNVPDGSITGAKIANLAIDSTKVSSLSWSKIIDRPTWFGGDLGSAVAGGDLTGNYPNPTVAALAITTGKLALLSVDTTILAANAVTGAKVLDGTLTAAKQILGTWNYFGTAGGTGDVITLTPTVALAAYAAGVTGQFLASAVNTTFVTINISGLGAIALKMPDGSALAGGEIQSGDLVSFNLKSATEIRLVNYSRKKYAPAAVSVTDANFPANTVKNWGTHGLGSVPKNVRAYLRCTTIDLAYAVGDIIPLEYSFDPTGLAQSWSAIYVNATNIYSVNRYRPIADGCSVRRLDGTIGLYAQITTARWEMFVEASN